MKPKTLGDIKAYTLPGIEVPAVMVISGPGVRRAVVENGHVIEGHIGLRDHWHREFPALSPSDTQQILDTISFLHRVIWAMESTAGEACDTERPRKR